MTLYNFGSRSYTAICVLSVPTQRPDRLSPAGSFGIMFASRFRSCRITAEVILSDLFSQRFPQLVEHITVFRENGIVIVSDISDIPFFCRVFKRFSVSGERDCADIH